MSTGVSEVTHVHGNAHRPCTGGTGAGHDGLGGRRPFIRLFCAVLVLAAGAASPAVATAHRDPLSTGALRSAPLLGRNPIRVVMVMGAHCRAPGGVHICR